MPNVAYEKIAADLRAAYSGKAIEPIAGRFGDFDIADAYYVQEINTFAWASEGKTMVGRKIGLSSKAVQRQLGVSQTDYGILFNDMQVESGARVGGYRLHHPRVEVELAVRLAADLNEPKITPYDVAASVEWIAPAIEVVDSRIDNWRISILDTIADNASSGLFAVGQGRDPAEIDLPACDIRFRANGRELFGGPHPLSLKTPYEAIAWLANSTNAAGLPLMAGDLILTGAILPLVTAQPGVTFDARIHGLGAVSISF